MVRETKAQREARVANEKLRHEQECRKSYLQRLMDALRAATKEEWHIDVAAGKFFVYGENETFEFGLDWDWKNDYALSDLQFQMDVAASAQRKAVLRNNALAKLTQEERELLNL
jgi:hypothetical protein